MSGETQSSVNLSSKEHLLNFDSHDVPDATQDMNPLSFYVKSLLSLAFPNAITSIMWPLHTFIGLYYVGFLENVLELDAYSLAISWSGIFAYSIQIGISSTLDTLVSQSFGKQEYKMCGLFMNRAFLIVSIVTIPCSILQLFSGPIFIMAGIDKDLAITANQITNWMIIPIFLNIPWIMLDKFLVQQQIVFPSVIIQGFNTILYPLYCQVFIFWMNMGIYGAVAAKTASIIFYVTILIIYLVISKRCEKTLAPLGWDALRGWKEYLSLAFPTTVMCCLEWWTWEILNLACGILGYAQLAANMTLLNLGSLTFIIAAGLGAASCTLVGNSVGEGNIVKAKKYSIVGIYLTVIGISILSIFIMIFKKNLSAIFTSDTQVIEILSILIIIFIIQQFADITQTVMARIIIASGKQSEGSIANLVCYYAIMLPCALLFAFVFKIGIYGIWIGCTLGSASILTWYSRLLWTIDWNNTVQNAYERIESSKKA